MFILQNLLDDFDAPKMVKDSIKQPKLLYHHDNMVRRLDHLRPLEGLDPAQAELDMMRHLPIRDMCQWPRPTSRLSKDRAARLQELIHFCATGGLTQTGEHCNCYLS